MLARDAPSDGNQVGGAGPDRADEGARMTRRRDCTCLKGHSLPGSAPGGESETARESVKRAATLQKSRCRSTLEMGVVVHKCMLVLQISMLGTSHFDFFFHH